MARNCFTFSLIALAIADLPMLACAATPGAGEPAAPAEQSMFGEHAEVTVGAGASLAARYPGADRSQFLPAPAFSIQRGILFVDTLRGAGLQYLSSSGGYISQSLYYDFGRLDKDNRWRTGSSRLAGMGTVSDSTTTRTLIAQQLTPKLLLSSETEVALRDTARRNRYRSGVELVALKTASDNVTVDLDAWWGDGRYNAAYFGVTLQQAARSRFHAFDPGAGLYAESPSVSWEHHLDSHWSSTLELTDTRYDGKAAASPVVAQRTSIGATVALTYTY